MNKVCHFNIFRMMNRRTLVIIEVKLDLTADITVSSKTNLSQLFLGAKYKRKREHGIYNEFLCLLTNTKIWHFFTDLSSQPYITKEYVKVECQAINIKKVTEVILHYVPKRFGRLIYQ